MLLVYGVLGLRHRQPTAICCCVAKTHTYTCNKNVQGQLSYSDHSEVDVFSFQGIGAGALQDGKVLIVFFHSIVDPAHCLHGLHPTGHYHRTS